MEEFGVAIERHQSVLPTIQARLTTTR